MSRFDSNLFVRSLWTVAILLSGTTGKLGAVTTVPHAFSINQPIPDGLFSGISDTRTISLPGLDSISDLQVRMTISGGFNGDFYAYLTHGSGFSVLLNRPGRTTENPIGYGDSGLNVTFVNQVANDIHRYQDFATPSGALTGLWSPDGRNVHPAIVLNTDPRTALLSDFGGLDPNGDWTLFVADVDGGSQGVWVSWGLDLTVVPEPGNLALAIFGCVALILFRYTFRFRSHF